MTTPTTQPRATGQAAQRLLTAINAHGPAVDQTAVVLHAASELLDQNAFLVAALEDALTALQSFPGMDRDTRLGDGTGMTMHQARASLQAAK